MSGTRSRQEVVDALVSERRALGASSKAYDDGEHWEAARLATAVHVVVHDHGRTVSLLAQLGIKASTRFISSGRPTNPRNLLRETPLIKTRVTNTDHGTTARFLPLLGDGTYEYRLLQFSKWWETELISRDGELSLTRKRLVFMLRSKEGGARFDPIQDDASYKRLARENITTPLLCVEGSTPKAILGAERASMRQIAWEPTTTLDRILLH